MFMCKVFWKKQTKATFSSSIKKKARVSPNKSILFYKIDNSTQVKIGVSGVGRLWSPKSKVMISKESKKRAFKIVFSDLGYSQALEKKQWETFSYM